MVLKKRKDDPGLIQDIAVQGIIEKKGQEIVCLDLRNVNTSVADYFIVCHAESGTQVRAIADSVEEEIYKAFREDPWQKEGVENSEWIILDYVTVVVHIFKKEKRYFYGIEELWGDAEVIYQSA
ncbi:ribosome-associated protein [Anseongella ginsenosidimutans]|uniref:Ribosomal silencing factor RsfS n=1 Tax=Anseongella ginsenosidimutans TaxID=496056 RepID=A0A4R3KZM8_9SPHI|nr:ribosome silencing factor [Anseongella ginsenosidimutans]QEC51232.1 ribosome silencing factor [Anseongella ginsenosidimutans]TCS90090.1 ribosome-associated protein [Anseongella ginsenosidimutans]